MHHKDIYMTIRCLYAVASGIVGGRGGAGVFVFSRLCNFVTLFVTMLCYQKTVI